MLLFRPRHKSVTVKSYFHFHFLVDGFFCYSAEPLPLEVSSRVYRLLQGPPSFRTVEEALFACAKCKRVVFWSREVEVPTTKIGIYNVGYTAFQFSCRSSGKMVGLNKKEKKKTRPLGSRKKGPNPTKKKILVRSFCGSL